MVRTKQIDPVQQARLDHEEEERQARTARYGAPFQLYSDVEAEIFLRLSRKEFPAPRTIGWIEVDTFRLTTQVKHYLSLLGLDKFADMCFHGFSPLAYEFLVSLEFTHNWRSMKCRLMNESFEVKPQHMNQVFKFNLSEVTERPKEFDLHSAWFEISGFKNWDTIGVPAGLIIDPALAICHKFIAYTISGKEQANKVNADELFMLWSVYKGQQVCPVWFLWRKLHRIQNNAKARPSLSQYATGLAQHFKMTDNNGDPPRYTRIMQCVRMPFSEYQTFGRPDGHLIEHSARRIVKKFLQDAELPNAMDIEADGAGPSHTSPPVTVPFASTSQSAPNFTTTVDFQRLSDQLVGFQTHFDTSFGEFRQDVNGRFDQLSGDMTYMHGRIDEMYGRMSDMTGQMGRLEGHVTPFSSQLHDMYSHLTQVHETVDDLREYTSSWDGHMDSLHTQIRDTDAHVLALQAQWNDWTFNAPPPQHPPPQDPPANA